MIITNLDGDRMIGVQSKKFTLLIAFLSLLIVSFASCEKKSEDLPSIFSNPSFGNVQSDIFFKKNLLKKFEIKGRIVASVYSDGKPQIAILNTKDSSIKLLTKNGIWNRTPVFSGDGNNIYFSSYSTKSSVIKEFDLIKGKETTLVAGSEDRYDPIKFRENKIIYNVFPKKGNFYLAVFDLKTRKEDKLSIEWNGKNLAERAAEPCYDNNNDTIYFVTDLAYDGKPKPINIWAYNFKTSTARQITKNATATVIIYQGKKIVSPQFFDISVSEYGYLLYCIRYITQETEGGVPTVSKIEAHLMNLKTGEDRIFAVEKNSIRQPIQVNRNYVLLAYPELREILLINLKKPHERNIFISLIDIVGDYDFAQ
ncbi:MAG: hypothetical protein N2440_01825 [Actinobacteria bacterium]|nr:hypothetical protein [Actinomycetota bacterium]